MFGVLADELLLDELQHVRLLLQGAAVETPHVGIALGEPLGIEGSGRFAVVEPRRDEGMEIERRHAERLALGRHVDADAFALAWRAGYVPAMRRVASGELG